MKVLERECSGLTVYDASGKMLVLITESGYIHGASTDDCEWWQGRYEPMRTISTYEYVSAADGTRVVLCPCKICKIVCNPVCKIVCKEPGAVL